MEFKCDPDSKEMKDKNCKTCNIDNECTSCHTYTGRFLQKGKCVCDVFYVD